LGFQLPFISGDSILLEQVVLNLVSNACDAMIRTPRSERCITITTQTEIGGETLRMTVMDAGCGLPSEPERMFEAFFTTKDHGLGMGLPICRSIIHAHGGKVWAQANAGRGATVHLTLPTLGGVR
jgi:signal transduction histidine kinase